MLPKQAFILAGGRGERLQPLTENIPKPMVKVQEKPILQHVIEQLTEYGITNIVLAVAYKSKKVEGFFKDGANFRTNIVYSLEKEFLGTGGALKNAQELLENKFIMLNGDTLMDIDFEKMNEFHEKKNASCTIALVQVKDVRGFGVIKYSDDKILDFVEKPNPDNAPSNWINAGAYILEKKTVELIPEKFNLIEKTLFPTLASQKKLFGFKHIGQWFPIDDMNRLEKANIEWKRKGN